MAEKLAACWACRLGMEGHFGNLLLKIKLLLISPLLMNPVINLMGAPTMPTMQERIAGLLIATASLSWLRSACRQLDRAASDAVGLMSPGKAL